MPPTVSRVEEARETGLSLEFVGGMLLFFDFLVLFFLPAGFKLGQQHGFAILMCALFGGGLGFIIAGYVLRARAK